MKSLVTLMIVVCFLPVLSGCSLLCGEEPALMLRSPIAAVPITKSTQIPPPNQVGVFAAPVRAEAMPSYGYNACPPGPAPQPLFGSTREK